MFKSRFLSFALIGAAAVAVALAAFIPAASASPFYAGVGVQYAGFNYEKGVAKTAPDALFGGSVYGGIQVTKHVAFEAGYLGAWNSQDFLTALKTPATTDAAVYGGTADIVATLPVTSRFALLGDVGLTYLRGDITQAGTPYRSWNWGWRAGAGGEYALNDHVSLRVRGFYQQANLKAARAALVVETGFVLHI